MIVGNGLSPYRFTEYMDNVVVKTFELNTAYPNPFNPTTNIDYSINKASNIKITIYDVSGRMVEILESGYKNQGNYNLLWNASNKSSGIYYIQIQSDENVVTEKIVLLK